MFTTLSGTKPLKFIELKHHTITEEIKKNNFALSHINFNSQKADILTKTLRLVEFERK